VVKPGDVKVDKEIIEKLPRELVEKHSLVPISHDATHLRLALPDAGDLPVVEEVRFLTGLEVQIALISSHLAGEAIGRYYSAKDGAGAPQRRRARQDVREIAREVQGRPGLSEAARAVAAIDVPAAKLTRALAILLVEKQLISADELGDRARRLE
jgi:hypothetical protein